MTPEKRDAVLRALAAHAQLRGRTLDDEMDLGLQIHLCNHALAQLHDDLGREEVEAQGFDPVSERERVMQRLAELCEIAYAPPEVREPEQLH